MFKIDKKKIFLATFLFIVTVLALAFFFLGGASYSSTESCEKEYIALDSLNKSVTSEREAVTLMIKYTGGDNLNVDIMRRIGVKYLTV